MGSGAARSLLPALLLLLLLLPTVWGHCGPLPNLTHAEPPENVKHQKSFTFGTSVTYRCLSGYVKRPLLLDTIRCLETSQWSDLPEFCGRSCPSPPRVTFARISPQDGSRKFFPLNTSVKYTCRQGYESTTDQLPTSTCLHNYKWSEVPELCRRKSCGVPANPEHGQVTANDHLFGAQAEVVCNRGYVLKGASSLILCSIRGDGVAWSQLPACRALSCPPPPAIPDGKHDGTDTEEFTYDMLVTYTCNPGLQLVGNETLRCTTENGIRGIWSGSAPECRVSTTVATVQPGTTVEKEAENPPWLGHCGPLPNLTHAEPPENVKHQKSFTFGTSVTYRCLSGYVKRPLLLDTIRCLETSQWSDLPEFCGRSCPSPPRVTFARISPQDGSRKFFPLNTSVKYTCRQGYESTTDQLPTSTCLHNYKWSEVPELCRRKSCGVPANPEHGQVTANDHLFGAQAEVVCNRGYVLKGASSLILCSIRGDGVAWSQLPACRALSCPPPPAIPDGKHDGTDTEEFTYDMLVTYTCNPGLQLVGNETLRCTTENGIRGVWSGSAPECRVSTTVATVQPGTTVEKEAENPPWLARFKQSDGLWGGCSLLSALLPLLLLLLPAVWGHCGPLPNLTHAEPPENVKHQKSFTFGTSVTYRCLSGYVKRPLLLDTIRCLETSQWSDLPEFCGRSCPSPPRVTFARISPQDGSRKFFPLNTSVKYTCRQGYESTTDQLPTSTCLHNYKWSEVPELCRRKSCGVPANPEHGQVTANDHLFGAQAEVVCNRGYVLKGASSLILCSIRGDGVAWSQLPACRALSCPPPPAIPDGKHDGTDTEEFTYDMLVTYTCNPGLQLVGNETLRCTTENGIRGVWSGSAPECRVSTTVATVQPGTTVEKEAENPPWLASILVPICIVLLVALAIIAGITMRRDSSKKDKESDSPQQLPGGV